MKLKHKSFVDAIQPKKTTVQLHNVVNSYKPISNHAANIAHDKQKKGEGKKSRDDKEKVLEVLFGLFEKHQVTIAFLQNSLVVRNDMEKYAFGGERIASRAKGKISQVAPLQKREDGS